MIQKRLMAVFLLVKLTQSWLKSALIKGITSLLIFDVNNMQIPTRYDEYSEAYDSLNSGIMTKSLGIDTLRMNAAKMVTGNVLEVAVGTGLQMQYYDWDKMASYSAIDQSMGMLTNAARRLDEEFHKNDIRIPFHFETMDAMDLKYSDDKVKTFRGETFIHE